ncbi:MAG: flagellar biosynthesis protein FlhF [Lachnospiraceae bacterium]|nr:flagellar biosynthesis protein FlhF [Lachnospiraceae bacterium]
MIIKKFIGKTEEDAVEAAKKELGNGIVIMNVKTAKKPGLAGFFGAKQVEVTVALEEENDAIERTRREKSENRGSAAGKAQGNGNQQDMAKPKSTQQMPDPESIEKKLESLQNLLETQIKSQARNTETIKADEKKDEKEPERDKESKKPQTAEEHIEASENPEQEKFIRLLYNTMIDNEVDEKYANQILEEIEKSKKPNIPIDYILANVYQKMILRFGKSDGIEKSEKKPKVVIFIGPTGVGKTTTIAKVASNYSMEGKKKIALLTSDTYRIAAAEQLRTYANILEVPFRVIYTEEEMQNAIRDFADCDYIFVDTAGHSHQNGEQIANMKKLLDAIDECASRQTFLVLSATTKYRDLTKIAKIYKDITNYQLIFTKLDETSSVGNLLNLKLYADTPIAFITYGQNVPDDIEQFNPQKTVKQLLGGKNEN